MSQLFSPFTLRGLTVKNRTVVSPMCQYSVEDGVPGAYHMAHLGRFALGGFGAVMVEASAVTPEGRITHGDTGLWNDAQADAFAPIVRFMKAQGAATGIQLAHAGRKGSSRRPWRGGGKVTEADRTELGDHPYPTEAPSALAHSDAYAQPEALDEAGIERIVRAFVDAARRAVAAGFDFVEVHSAHGYLLHQFLSPLANRRTDPYGGSRENRMRLPLRIVADVRATIPDAMPLLVRVSATDAAPGGWTIEDTVAYAREMKALGVDLVDCSSGGFAEGAITPHPLYQTPYAETLRREAGIPTMAVGLITQAGDAEAIVAQGRADLVALARAALDDPNWPLHAEEALGLADRIREDWPKQSGYAIAAQRKMLKAGAA